MKGAGMVVFDLTVCFIMVYVYFVRVGVWLGWFWEV